MDHRELGAASAGGMGSATLSLFDLRRHLLRRSGELAARARGLQARGDRVAASRAAEQAHRLRDVARSMRAG